MHRLWKYCGKGSARQTPHLGKRIAANILPLTHDQLFYSQLSYGQPSGART